MKKTLQYLLYAFFLVLTLAVSVMLFKSWKKLNKMKTRVSELESELQKKNIQYLELKQELFDLTYNPHAVEKVAREKFKMAGEGETIYTFPEQKQERKSK
jgi:cell division protein FtsL